ncbi:MAG: isoleucine--tRNA ligase [Capsulimonadaceae bacterium]|nr:isoleucine--tRNA ligase [Capsulimonadaceae bacterium]
MSDTATKQDKLDYSKTLNLPRPDVKTPNGLDVNEAGIPLRANLPVRELNQLAFWDAGDVYRKSLIPRSSQGTFILHDGPPYSNGDIHLGHALNKILKDIIVKYHSMTGYCAPYVPGWDNHGLPIETAVTKEYREKKVIPTPIELRHRCREYALEYVERQKAQFQRLGVRGDWDHPYLTMSSEFEAKIIEVFGELVKDGYVYRGVKPVHWCPTDRTALADAEIEYKDRKDESIFVAFPMRSDVTGALSSLTSLKLHALAWTTTPWTIPANLGLALNPAADYALIEHRDSAYLVAAALADRLIGQLGWEGAQTVSVGNAGAMQGVVFTHPLFDRESPIVFADYVTMEDGTGVVHTAPGHGREDFLTGQKNNLGVLSPVDAAGKFTAEAGEAFEGMSIWDGNGAVIAALEAAGALVGRTTIEHSYPHCWRCHNPVIFRATAQWFMSIDHKGHRQHSLDAIDNVTWYPKDAINRIRGMVGGRPDWCLSRQRAWGVGIPVFYCNGCQTEVVEPETIEHVRKLVLEHSSDVWFEREAAGLLPDGYRCSKCGGSDFDKEADIFDVWFDSGCTNRAVLESTSWKDLSWPADVYLEGGDQHRGWFNSSLMVGVATRGKAPYKAVVTNGWTLDDKGRAMHKSLGNAVEPAAVIKEYGADVLRLWVGGTDYFEDVRLSKPILVQVSDMYRRLRNTLRFALGNLYDFDVENHAEPYANLLEIDRYALHLLRQLVVDATAAYEAYEFHKAVQAIHQFCAVDMSSFYLDVLKDRLYAEAPRSRARRSAQTVLFEITSTLTRLLSPILSFTAEEVWQCLRMPDKPESVELASFPSPKAEFCDDDLADRWRALLEFRDRVNKAIETARQSKAIGKPLEAFVKIEAAPETYKLLLPYLAVLPSLFLVSEVELLLHEGPDAVTVSPASGTKCARCWLVKTDVDPATGLCGRCEAAISQSGAG